VQCVSYYKFSCGMFMCGVSSMLCVVFQYLSESFVKQGPRKNIAPMISIGESYIYSVCSVVYRVWGKFLGFSMLSF